ncbi:MAG: hypothetical protein JKY22_04230 [Flavobacteriaceae bacterium]|nr:hypothetical protein [Flavobacteriaceae bacterium]
MKKLSLILLLLVSTFTFAQTEIAVTPQITFKIGLETTVTSDGVAIQFHEVLEDSRCPENVQCVWAGQARVKVTVSTSEMPEKTLELIVGKKEKNILYVGNDFVLKAINLAPYPIATNVQNKEYILFILKEKVSN